MLASKMMVKNTVWFSLIVQIVTGIVSLHGLFLTLPKKDAILTDILGLETIVQFIEATFYIWIAYAAVNVNVMASRRYMDWVITTPTMLISTIMFMKYQEHKEQNKLKSEPVTTSKFFQENRDLIIQICAYNLGMLLFGYLGEINVISKSVSIPIGFFFFGKAFSLIYYNYANKSILGEKLYKFLLGVWGLYGVAAMAPPNLKNISYNLLDIVSKNFYGLYIYYKILQVHSEN
tara:strand:- start:973 stop:1671 length:699 start_codon:yes stop_codon:yes gene_type:complete